MNSRSIHLSSALAVCLFSSVATGGDVGIEKGNPIDINQTTTAFVRGFMQSLARGEIKHPQGIRAGQARAVSGWMMTTERGKKFGRWTLNDQADHLIPLGADAVPELLRWVGHAQMEVRYVAAHSLKEITGKDPYFPTFATLKEHEDKGWLRDAAAVWSSWYQEQINRRAKMGAQPATAPCSEPAARSPQR